MFRLTADEWASSRSQFATLKTGRGQHRKYLPFAVTEHGAIMAAMVLGSPRAVEVSTYVVRAFVRLREMALDHRDLAKRLDALEEKAELLDMRHDSFSRNTRSQLKQVFDALRVLMTPPDAPRRPIGFATPEDRKNAPKGAKSTRGGTATWVTAFSAFPFAARVNILPARASISGSSPLPRNAQTPFTNTRSIPRLALRGWS